jgi:hypothetical protein
LALTIDKFSDDDTLVKENSRRETCHASCDQRC